MGPTMIERASNALSAMMALGITEKRVRPVLKRLLRLYDKNWEPIEDENYRVLLDAIFELENEEEEDNKSNEAVLDDESPVPPLKRMRLRSRGDMVSCSGETSLRKPKTEKADPPSAHRLRNAERTPVSPRVVEMNVQEINESYETVSDNEEPSQLLRRDRVDHDSISSQFHAQGKGKERACSSQVPRDEVVQDHSPLKRNLAERDSVSPQKHVGVRGTGTSLPQMIHKDRGARPAKSSSGVCFKEPKIEPGIIILPKEKFPNSRQKDSVIKPKSEPAEDYIPFEIPIAIMAPPESEHTINDDPIAILAPPGSEHTVNDDPIAILAPPEPENSIYDDQEHRDGFSTISGSIRHMNGMGSMSSKDKDDDFSGRSCKPLPSSELANVQELPTSFEIASSFSGDVRISLSCNQAFDHPDFSLDAVLKAVEEKCLREYQILEPKFSLIKLMQEMCQSFWEMSNKSTNHKEDKVIHLAPDFNFLKRSNLQNAFGAGGHMSNGSLSLLSSTEMVLPETPNMLLLDGLDSQHSQKTDGETNGNEDTFGNDSDSSNSHSLVVVPQQGFTTDNVRTLHDVNDISRGEERVQISLINEVSSDPFPPSFHYIPRNVVYQNAYVNCSLARIGDEDCCSNCFGDCLLSSIPCACARETGGEFAYTLEGLVKEKFLDECISMHRDPQQHRHYYCKECPLERSKEGFTDPCKGHLVRKFIKECWSKCGCNKQCGNRVVQRGIACNLQVFLTTEGKGWGLRTLEYLPRGTFVCEYVGEVLTNTELYERNMRSTGNEKHTYPVLLDADWGSEGVLKDEEALCLDATHYGNVARFINHRCFDATLVEIPVEVETPDHHYYHLAFFTTRNVDALEELTWDYGIDFNDHNHPVKAFRCRCGSKCCRDMKRSHRTKSKR